MCKCSEFLLSLLLNAFTLSQSKKINSFSRVSPLPNHISLNATGQSCVCKYLLATSALPRDKNCQRGNPHNRGEWLCNHLSFPSEGNKVALTAVSSEEGSIQQYKNFQKCKKSKQAWLKGKRNMFSCDNIVSRKQCPWFFPRIFLNACYTR